MIKKIFSIVGFLAVSCLLLAAGLSCSTDKITASLGQEFTLPAGKTAVISGESLSIKFVEVTGDSRCPTGVQCIQAGDVKCLMLISYYQSSSSIVYTQPGGNEDNKEVFNKYIISFRVEPYPKSSKQIASSDYKMIMTVNE